MNIREALGSVNSNVAAMTDTEDMIRIIDELDGQIFREIFATHEGADDISLPCYDADTDLDTELLAVAPYCRIYALYIEAMTYYAVVETDRYNNAWAAFDSAYKEYARWYNHMHMPLGQKMRF